MIWWANSMEKYAVIASGITPPESSDDKEKSAAELEDHLLKRLEQAVSDEAALVDSRK